MNLSSQPCIIDIEASGFGPNGYPIEVGVALAHGDKYCSLLLPEPDWSHWDRGAEKAHKIPRETLETYGRPLREVALKLNEVVNGNTVYSDGWVVDKPWLTQLFFRAQVRQEFTISSLEMILTEKQMNIWHNTKDKVVRDLGLERHRASVDARIIQETYFRTLQETY